MKNIMQTIKVPDAVKSVDNIKKNDDKQQQALGQQSNPLDEHKTFKSVLEKQVQEKKPVEKKLDEKNVNKADAKTQSHKTLQQSAVSKNNNIDQVKTSSEVGVAEKSAITPNFDKQKSDKLDAAVTNKALQTSDVKAQLSSNAVLTAADKPSKTIDKALKVHAEVALATANKKQANSVEVSDVADVKATVVAASTNQPKTPKIAQTYKAIKSADMHQQKDVAEDVDVDLTQKNVPIDQQHLRKENVATDEHASRSALKSKHSVKADKVKQTVVEQQVSYDDQLVNLTDIKTRDARLTDHDRASEQQVVQTQDDQVEKLTVEQARGAVLKNQDLANAQQRESSDAKQVEITQTEVPVIAAKQTSESMPSTIDAMVGKKKDADLRHKVLDKLAQAKEVQFEEKDVPMSLEDPVDLQNTRLTEDLSRLGRNTDFAQTLSQSVLNSQFKVRGEQVSAFKGVTSTEKSLGELSAANVNIQATAPTMQSANPALTASTLGASNQIYAYPGKAGWDQAISQKVLFMVGAGEQTAKLTLNPPELGPLQVVINVNNEKADTTFISANAEVRQALEDGLEDLREKMGDAGVSLGQANVSDEDQKFAQEQENNTENKALTTAGQRSQEAENMVTNQPIIRESNGLVDTFA